MKPDRSEARKVTRAANSSGVPKRPMGMQASQPLMTASGVVPSFLGDIDGEFAHPFGHGVARTDIVYRHVVGSQLIGERLGKTDDPGAHGVGENEPIDGLFHRYGGHVDDPPPAFFHHYGNDFPGHNDGTHKIQSYPQIPLIIVDFEEGPVGRSAGVVDEDVHRAEMFNPLANKTPGLLRHCSGQPECR